MRESLAAAISIASCLASITNGSSALFRHVWRSAIRHGPTGWYWVLDVDDHPVAVDVLDDPLGIGPYCFPNRMAFGIPESSLPAVRAAFVTVKRIRKGSRESKDWPAIAHMAAIDAEKYVDCLDVSLGERLARRVSGDILAGQMPSAEAFDRAALALRLRRIRTPEHALRLLRSSASRLIDRLAHPTGLSIVIVGPDGTGKSTLAAAITRDLQGYFWRNRHIHWRPGVLPRPGALVGASASGTDQPHASAPHGIAGSLPSSFTTGSTSSSVCGRTSCHSGCAVAS